MKVKDIMDKNIPTVKHNEKVDKVVKTLMKIPQSAIPVVDKNKKVIGEISQMDLLLKLVGKREIGSEGLNFGSIKNFISSESDTIDSMYERHELNTSPEADILKVVKIMYDNDISTVPVVDDSDKLLGVITDICILKNYKKISKLE
jgi:predicted transcriptional regulator